MRLAHKRKVQMKLQKRINALAVNQASTSANVASKAPKVAKEAAPKAVVSATVALTPKQQQVLDIVAGHSDGVNPKAIGLAAGQEDAKAASWASGALKKLVEENLVEKVALAGNKVSYKLK